MNRSTHRAGVAIAGAITIDPPLDDDEIDQVELIGLTTSHEELRDGLAGMIDGMLPGRPGGPSGWSTCDEGCCLEVTSPYMKAESIGPWLSYLIDRIASGPQARPRRYDGSVVIWSAEDRSFDALWVEGGEVRRGRMDRPRARERREPASVVTLDRRRA